MSVAELDRALAFYRGALGFTDKYQAGATGRRRPADQPWGERQAVLTDPDGHVRCLVAATT